MLVLIAIMYSEFNKVKDKLLDKMNVNNCSKHEHVHDIERKICHVTKRCCCLKANLGMHVLPNVIIKHLVINVTMLVNAHLDEQGISQEFLPHEIVLLWQQDSLTHCSLTHCKAQFGSMFLANDQNTPTSTVDDHAWHCINFGPMGNFQGTHKFLCIKTGRVIKCRCFMVPNVQQHS